MQKKLTRGMKVSGRWLPRATMQLAARSGSRPGGRTGQRLLPSGLPKQMKARRTPITWKAQQMAATLRAGRLMV